MIITARLENDEVRLCLSDVAQTEHALDVDDSTAGQRGLQCRMQPFHHVAVLSPHWGHVNDFALDQLDGGPPVQEAVFGHPVIFFGSESMSMRPSLEFTGSHDFPRSRPKVYV